MSVSSLSCDQVQSPTGDVYLKQPSDWSSFLSPSSDVLSLFSFLRNSSRPSGRRFSECRPMQIALSVASPPAPGIPFGSASVTRGTSRVYAAATAELGSRAAYPMGACLAVSLSESFAFTNEPTMGAMLGLFDDPVTLAAPCPLSDASSSSTRATRTPSPARLETAIRAESKTFETDALAIGTVLRAAIDHNRLVVVHPRGTNESSSETPEAGDMVWVINVDIQSLGRTNGGLMDLAYTAALLAILTMELPALVWDIHLRWWRALPPDTTHSENSYFRPSCKGVHLFKEIPILISLCVIRVPPKEQGGEFRDVPLVDGDPLELTVGAVETATVVYPAGGLLQTGEIKLLGKTGWLRMGVCGSVAPEELEQRTRLVGGAATEVIKSVSKALKEM